VRGPAQEREIGRHLQLGITRRVGSLAHAPTRTDHA
jgi:hypothetical protein